MNAKVSEKGQVTIPKPLRDRLGIRAGETLDFEASGGRLIARKAGGRDPVDALYGMLELPERPDALLDDLRGPGPTP
ncbi:MAG TPA: AbrB/MazE/SpoVT family DNA-binding domain-containing protein [Thermoleophilaceae bacterium]|nr:AbrB/MazE/SpoVT family DNA-binding domain-containing protein [Thermoleophilaceae bacterium]